MENTNVYLPDEQLKIASFIYIKDKNPEFRKLFLIKDCLSFKNQMAKYVASDLVNIHGIGSIDYQLHVLATSRRLVRKKNGKFTCLVRKCDLKA